MPCAVAVVIWFNCAVMRYNRFYVLDGVVLPRALSCDCGAFYKCLLCVWLDGVTVCVCAVPSVVGVSVVCVLLACACCLLLA